MKEHINRTLLELLPLNGELLFEAAHYSLEGGKRLRPLLTLAIVQTFDQPIEHALRPACTLEMIHTYSLIHDDLPCMDDDDFRRGKPSLHKAYHESHAVLTGDFLLTYAFEVLATAPNLTDTQKTRLIATLAHRAGSQGMIGGQILDIAEATAKHPMPRKIDDFESACQQQSGQSPAPEYILEESRTRGKGGKMAQKCDFAAHRYCAIASEGKTDDFQQMHAKKTGALITAACEFGGIIANIDDLTPFQTIGQHLGLAYQIVDDILDNDGLVEVIGLNEAEELAEKLFNQAMQSIQTLPNGAPKLAQLAQEMIFRSV
ncbi:MAG: polyprenyl synthetase family protein [Verrucomicrobia bacterium]|nr:polyprenyl synthetase family protein [Verrucomicrobiota bacterium]